MELARQMTSEELEMACLLVAGGSCLVEGDLEAVAFLGQKASELKQAGLDALELGNG